MKIDLAIKIVTEYQKWRRGEPPYDGDTPETHRLFEYSPQVLGQAIDALLNASRETLKRRNDKKILLSLEKHRENKN